MYRNHLIAVVPGLFLALVPTPGFSQSCSSPLPKNVDSVNAEMQRGEGYWPCSVPPFVQESACDTGYRYRKFEDETGYEIGIGSYIDTWRFTIRSTAGDPETCQSSREEVLDYFNGQINYHDVYEVDYFQVIRDQIPSSSYTTVHEFGYTSCTVSPTSIIIDGHYYDPNYEWYGNYGFTDNGHSYITLSDPVGIKLRAPEPVPDSPTTPKQAYRLPNETWQTCALTAYIITCPGEYEVTLYYKKIPYAGPTPNPVPLGKVSKTEKFEGDMPSPKGYEVEFELPTSTCFISELDRIEYRPVGGCGTGTTPGSTEGGLSSIQVVSSLGSLADGSSSGSLYIHENTITPRLFTPDSLWLLAPKVDAQLRVVRDPAGQLRQIISRQAFVDITLLQVNGVDSGYEVAFYTPPSVPSALDAQTGLYPVPATTPYATILCENPDAPTVPIAAATRFRVTASQTGQNPKIWLFQQETNGAMSLVEGDGLLRSVILTTTSGPDTTRRIDRYGPATASTPAAVEWSITRAFAFGSRPVEESRGTGTARVWTTYSYDEVSTSPTYGQLLSKLSSDGAWERYEYDSTGQLSATVSPLGDAAPTEATPALLRRVEKLRSSPTSSAYGAGELVTMVEYQGGVEVFRRHHFKRADEQSLTLGTGHTYPTIHEIDVVASAPGAAIAWDSPNNQFTHSYRLISSYPEHGGESALEISPAGHVTLTRHTLEGTNRVIERWVGTPNSTPTPTSTPTDIIAGTRTKTIATAANVALSDDTYDAASASSASAPYSGLLLASLTYADHDPSGRPQTVLHLDGSTETRDYNPCCGQLTRVVHRGVTTSYGYDALGRREWEKVEAGSGASLQTISHTRYTYDSAGRVLTRSRVPTSGAEQLLERNTYDDAGTLLSTATPGSLASDPDLTRLTTYLNVYDAATGRSTRTVTRAAGTADAATEITVTDRAGRTLSRTGTAVAPVRYDYGTAALADAADWGLSTSAPLPYTREIKLNAAGADTTETLTTYTDPLGRTIKTVYADGAAARSFYDIAGRLVRQSDPDGVQTLFAYTAPTATTGEIQVTALDLNRDGVIDYSGADRITRQTRLVSTRVEGSSTYTVQRSTTEVWETDASSTATLVSTTETTPDGLRSWQTAYGLTTASVTAYDEATGQRTDTSTLPDNTSQVRVSAAGRAVSDTRKNSAGATVTQTTYGYDAHGRLATQTLVGVGTTTTTYYADDQPATVTTPDPDATRSGPGYDAQTTTYAYDAAGRVTTVTQPDTTQTFTTYWPTGQVKRSWGSRTYPSEYAYDAQGRVKTLTTWQSFATSSGAALTTWNYSPLRGWLTSKRYADNTGPDYDYWPSGRLKTRDWARNASGTSTRLRTSYAYTNAGDLAGIDYADTTPDVAHTYDRLGRLKTTTDAAGVLTRSYEKGRLDDETYAAGSAHLSGRALTRTLDTLNRPATLGGTSLTSVSYAYDTAGRLFTLTQGTRVATLGYEPSAGTHQSTAIAVSGAARATVTRTTDALGRISRVDTTGGATLQARRDYTYDAANQRTEVVHEDALRWAYGYDPLGQVTSAQKRNSSSLALAGYDHAYLYDTIGNRVSTTTNGRTAAYSPNALNQYSTREVPAALDVLGISATDVNVLVNGEATARDGGLFYRAVPVSNAAAPLFQSITILAARPGNPDQVATDTRGGFVAQTPEAFGYDFDGNLLQDGRWTYVWDAENRLIEQSTRADVATAASGLTRQKLVFGYDAQGRRVRKQVFAWTGSAWATTPSTDLRFLYDGWNLLAEYNALASNAVVRSHVWSLDLSGSAQGAGGVGGLLWTSTASANYAPGYDANGNIVAWIDLSNGTVSGRRDYGAFGEPLVATGNAASLPFAFSTKYRDSETELYYYGHRYYNPSTGRWLSRDPIGERGGLNLYGMVRNNAINAFDGIGLAEYTAKNEIISRRNVETKKIECGTLTITYVFIDADMYGSVQGYEPGTFNYIKETAPPISNINLATINAPNYIGGGFALSFTPDPKKKLCCPKFRWRQYKEGWVGEEPDKLDYDWDKKWPTAIDFPGSDFGGYRDINYVDHFKLQLMCIKPDGTEEVKYELNWSLSVDFIATVPGGGGKSSATLKLNVGL